MAVLEILTYPNPRLAIPSKPVEVFDDVLKQFVEDMVETMYDAPGIGLAAPQLNIHKNIFVLDIDFEVDEETDEIINKNPRVYINPQVSSKEGEILYKEGCLSVPGVYEDVKRAATIHFEYQDIEGNSYAEELDGLLAIVVQHENDHLLGRLFIDRLSFVKSRSIKKKIKRELES